MKLTFVKKKTTTLTALFLFLRSTDVVNIIKKKHKILTFNSIRGIKNDISALHIESNCCNKREN